MRKGPYHGGRMRIMGRTDAWTPLATSGAFHCELPVRFPQQSRFARGVGKGGDRRLPWQLAASSQVLYHGFLSRNNRLPAVQGSADHEVSGSVDSTELPVAQRCCYDVFALGLCKEWAYRATYGLTWIRRVLNPNHLIDTQ